MIPWLASAILAAAAASETVPEHCSLLPQLSSIPPGTGDSGSYTQDGKQSGRMSPSLDTFGGSQLVQSMGSRGGVALDPVLTLHGHGTWLYFKENEVVPLQQSSEWNWNRDSLAGALYRATWRWEVSYVLQGINGFKQKRHDS